MAKLTVDSRPREEVKLITRPRSTKVDNPVIPTGDPRHMSHVRDGRQSAEVWSRQQRGDWHEEFEGEYPKGFRTTLKEAVVNANQPVSEGSTKSVSPDAKNIRSKKRSKRVLRSGEQEGQGEVNERESAKRLQKTKRLKAAQKKVSK